LSAIRYRGKNGREGIGGTGSKGFGEGGKVKDSLVALKWFSFVRDGGKKGF